MHRDELADAATVMSRFGFAVGDGGGLQRVGGGFSGADVWRVDTAAGSCCLRRWPAESPGFDRIRWIHAVLRHAHAAGCRFLPLPLQTDGGATVVELHARHWELTNWIAGRSDDSPTLDAARLSAVLRAFAQFHKSTVDEPWAAVAAAPSPGIVERLTRLDQMLTEDMTALLRAEVPFAWGPLGARRGEYFELFRRTASAVRGQLVEQSRRMLQLQPCVRDIRREHLLFDGVQLVGLVDFGAMQMDHPAIDVARVLGECAGGDEPRRCAALDDYREAAGSRVAEDVDWPLVSAFDAANTLLSPGNWLRWILLEGRDFAERAAVLSRFDQLMTRLRQFAAVAP